MCFLQVLREVFQILYETVFRGERVSQVKRLLSRDCQNSRVTKKIQKGSVYSFRPSTAASKSSSKECNSSWNLRICIYLLPMASWMCLVHEILLVGRAHLNMLLRRMLWQFSENSWVVDVSLSESRGPAENLRKPQYSINGSVEQSFPSIQLMYLKSVMSNTACVASNNLLKHICHGKSKQWSALLSDQLTALRQAELKLFWNPKWTDLVIRKSVVLFHASSCSFYHIYFYKWLLSSCNLSFMALWKLPKVWFLRTLCAV